MVEIQTSEVDAKHEPVSLVSFAFSQNNKYVFLLFKVLFCVVQDTQMTMMFYVRFK
jgi:hypothetical protein